MIYKHCSHKILNLYRFFICDGLYFMLLSKSCYETKQMVSTRRKHSICFCWSRTDTVTVLCKCRVFALWKKHGYVDWYCFFICWIVNVFYCYFTRFYGMEKAMYDVSKRHFDIDIYANPSIYWGYAIHTGGVLKGPGAISWPVGYFPVQSAEWITIIFNPEMTM